MRSLGSRLEKPCGPEPFVDAEGIHKNFADFSGKNFFLFVLKAPSMRDGKLQGGFAQPQVQIPNNAPL